MKSYMQDSTTNFRNEVNVLNPEPAPLIPRGYSRISPGVNFSAMVQHTNKGGGVQGQRILRRVN